MYHSFTRSIVTAVIFFICVSFSVHAAQYYVVIGAFTEEINARELAENVKDAYPEASYQFNDERDLYYVHVMQTTEKDEARNWTLFLKYEFGFKDAWVYTDLPGDIQSYRANDGARQPRYPHTLFLPAGKPSSRFNQRNEKLITDNNLVATNNIVSADHAVTAKHLATASKEALIAIEGVHNATATATSATWKSANQLSYMAGIKNIAGAKSAAGMASAELFTFIVENVEGTTIPAEVMLVDYAKSRKLTSFNTGEYVALKGKKKDQVFTVVCDVFGYSQITRNFNIDRLSSVSDIKKNEAGVWEVRFQLKRFRKNEMSFMYNTSFYEDAAILQPSSKQQVDELLSLMQSYPEYQILIHSHCNKGPRRDIKLPGSDKNCFDLEDAIEKTGSDKQLTKQRAETIRDYLVANGIDGNRVAVMGWGSLDMLEDSAGADAGLNDRIEVEVLEDR